MLQYGNCAYRSPFNILKRFSSTSWSTVVGLEVHAQISSASKLFSGSSNKFSSPVNSNVSLFDCSTPGTLPVLNKQCVKAGVMTALALNCHINPVSWFDRKHYFYADIPVGYQITQQRFPLASNGALKFHVFTPGIHKTPYQLEVKIKQVQLEQDSGKSLHDSDRSLIDLNRAGAPLMEIVFEPDLKDGEEAAALIKELQTILRRINTCSCKMEEGALRVDANVSIHKKGEPFGTRTEIKNISSVRGVASAIRYEIQRQIKVKESGGIVQNETRAWDAVHKVTVGMRDKEEQQDYRYMPEPNLPPLHVLPKSINQDIIGVEELKALIPELPQETRQRLQTELNLLPEHAVILVNDFYLLKIFEEVLALKKVSPKLLTTVLINDLNKILNKADVEAEALYKMDSFRLNNLAQIIELLENNSINRNTVNVLFNELLAGNTKTPIEIVKEKNLLQITDESELKFLCQEVLRKNPKAVEDYKAGKQKVFKAFLGEIAKTTGNKADMNRCSQILKDLLSGK